MNSVFVGKVHPCSHGRSDPLEFRFRLQKCCSIVSLQRLGEKGGHEFSQGDVFPILEFLQISQNRICNVDGCSQASDVLEKYIRCQDGCRIYHFPAEIVRLSTGGRSINVPDTFRAVASLDSVTVPSPPSVVSHKRPELLLVGFGRFDREAVQPGLSSLRSGSERIMGEAMRGILEDYRAPTITAAIFETLH